MSSIFDKLNLRPGERRLIVVVLVIVFIVVNFIWIVPHFKDLGVEREKLRKTRLSVGTALSENEKLPAYQKRLIALQGEATFVEDDQAIDLSKTLTRFAQQSGLVPQGLVPLNTPSDPTSFFEEKSYRITFNETSRENLNQFLVLLTTTESLIRIRELQVGPSPTRFGLNANITVVGSYQKKQMPKTPSAQTAKKP